MKNESLIAAPWEIKTLTEVLSVDGSAEEFLIVCDANAKPVCNLFMADYNGSEMEYEAFENVIGNCAVIVNAPEMFDLLQQVASAFSGDKTQFDSGFITGTVVAKVNGLLGKVNSDATALAQSREQSK